MMKTSSNCFFYWRLSVNICEIVNVVDVDDTKKCSWKHRGLNRIRAENSTLNLDEFWKTSVQPRSHVFGQSLLGITSPDESLNGVWLVAPNEGFVHEQVDSHSVNANVRHCLADQLPPAKECSMLLTF